MQSQLKCVMHRLPCNACIGYPVLFIIFLVFFLMRCMSDFDMSMLRTGKFVIFYFFASFNKMLTTSRKISTSVSFVIEEE